MSSKKALIYFERRHIFRDIYGGHQYIFLVIASTDLTSLRPPLPHYVLPALEYTHFGPLKVPRIFHGLWQLSSSAWSVTDVAHTRGESTPASAMLASVLLTGDGRGDGAVRRQRVLRLRGALSALSAELYPPDDN